MTSQPRQLQRKPTIHLFRTALSQSNQQVYTKKRRDPNLPMNADSVGGRVTGNGNVQTSAETVGVEGSIQAQALAQAPKARTLAEGGIEKSTSKRNPEEDLPHLPQAVEVVQGQYLNDLFNFVLSNSSYEFPLGCALSAQGGTNIAQKTYIHQFECSLVKWAEWLDLIDEFKYQQKVAMKCDSIIYPKLASKQNISLFLKWKQIFKQQKYFQMSVLAARRRTLFELSNKTGLDYHKKSSIFQAELQRKVSQYDQKEMPSRRRFQSNYVKSDQKQNQQKSHPVVKILDNSQSINDDELKKYTSFLYRGVKYSSNLKQPSEGYIEKRKLSVLDVSFPGEQFDLNKKLLVLDLDETIIHSVGHSSESDVTLKLGRNTLKFNIRPYCYRFLEEMAKHYNVIVYTASTENYAQPIVEYLNKPKRTIKAVFSRNHCLETHNGFYIKDLRVIKQFALKDILIIDNLAHSFAFQLDNGIPILEFLTNKKDRQLYFLTERLKDLSKVEDVRTEIKRIYNIRSILAYSQTDFVWRNESHL